MKPVPAVLLLAVLAGCASSSRVASPPDGSLRVTAGDHALTVSDPVELRLVGRTEWEGPYPAGTLPNAIPGATYELRPVGSVSAATVRVTIPQPVSPRFLALDSARRVQIYQLYPRTFAATDRSPAGVGTFRAIDDTALARIRDLGFSTVWLLGVMNHANRRQDDADIVKGNAGSPFAIRDYDAVDPDFGTMADLERLIGRIHRHGMTVMLDVVANHTARQYRPEMLGKRWTTYGASDDTTVAFSPTNDYYYLPGHPFTVPTYAADGGDDRYDTDLATPGIQPESPAKLTGNFNDLNSAHAAPDGRSWYETVRLNYGRELPSSTLQADSTAHTWRVLDDVVAYWQAKGVDDFRCDAAGFVPKPVWAFVIRNARRRNPASFWLAEWGPDADFTGMGFDANYHDGTKAAISDLYRGRTADIEPLTATLAPTIRGRFIESGGAVLRYVENHDQQRAASNDYLGGERDDPAGVRAATAFLFGLPGPTLFYAGAEVGEPAAGGEVFGGDDGRTTIFDYWTMPTFAAYRNGGRFDTDGLSEPEASLVPFVRALVRLGDRPALRAPQTASARSVFDLSDNRVRDTVFARCGYAYMRVAPAQPDAYLVVANFDKTAPHTFAIRFTPAARQALRGSLGVDHSLSFSDELPAEPVRGALVPVPSGDEAIVTLPPMTTRILRIARR